MKNSMEEERLESMDVDESSDNGQKLRRRRRQERNRRYRQQHGRSEKRRKRNNRKKNAGAEKRKRRAEYERDKISDNRKRKERRKRVTVSAVFDYRQELIEYMKNTLYKRRPHLQNQNLKTLADGEAKRVLNENAVARRIRLEDLAKWNRTLVKGRNSVSESLKKKYVYLSYGSREWRRKCDSHREMVAVELLMEDYKRTLSANVEPREKATFSEEDVRFAVRAKYQQVEIVRKRIVAKFLQNFSKFKTKIMMCDAAIRNHSSEEGREKARWKAYCGDENKMNHVLSQELFGFDKDKARVDYPSALLEAQRQFLSFDENPSKADKYIDKHENVKGSVNLVDAISLRASPSSHKTPTKTCPTSPKVSMFAVDSMDSNGLRTRRLQTPPVVD